MDNIEKFIGSESLTVSEAMQKIDVNANGILFLVNDGGTLISCITDGDIRRYLLSGGEMRGAVIDAANNHPKVARSRERTGR